MGRLAARSTRALITYGGPGEMHELALSGQLESPTAIEWTTQLGNGPDMGNTMVSEAGSMIQLGCRAPRHPRTTHSIKAWLWPAE